jgi:poly(3-hydroxybutyrate) depolymerase
VKRALALAACVAVLVATSPALGAEPTSTRFTDRPCQGCFVSLPSSDAPAPLLVLLHGDGQSASILYEKWRAWAAARQIAVLAPSCPASEGCKGSWWRWNGDSAWLAHQIDEVAALHPVDRERLWLVGWSGGASYIGWNTQELERSFAGIVIHGGGLAPASSACPRLPASVYFLVGDRNPLHDLAVDLRRHYDACGQDVHWSLLAGAAHEGEWEALNDKEGPAILDWLATKRRPPRGPTRTPEPAPAHASTPKPEPTPTRDAAFVPTLTPESTPTRERTPTPEPAPPRCSLRAGPLSEALGSTAVLAMLFTAARRRGRGAVR